MKALLCVLLFAGGGWLEQANRDPKTARLANPYAGQADAVKAGAKFYERHCAACHEAGRAPALRSDRVREASPGALFWLLRNGSLRRGMPSWSHLPPEQRWQIVAWLKSLD